MNIRLLSQNTGEDIMPYIFLHGLGQNSSSWDKTISCMAESVHPKCPDLLSLLDSKEVTYANLYHAFSKYGGKICEPLNLCGLSLGGVLALNYAIDYPEKVQSLVLIGAQYKMPKTLLKFQNMIFRMLPERSFVSMGFKKKDVIRLSNSVLELDFSEGLQDISCATLIICGEKDSANKKAAANLARSIPNAELCSMADSGHEINVEAPEKLANVLGAFWREQGVSSERK